LVRRRAANGVTWVGTTCRRIQLLKQVVEAINRTALKEWAVVCQALDRGRQTVSLRKGGINEPRDGFRVEHREFWLFPTQFHEGRESLVPEAEPLLAETLNNLAPPGTIRVANYVVVDEVLQITDLAQAERLAALHIWSAETIQRRFNYRQPGLFLLIMRVYRRPQPFLVTDTPELAGCHSWVELPVELTTAGLTPVLSDDQFAAVRQAVSGALGE
jgi:hypothetical protein